MKTETLVWTILLLAGALILILNGIVRGAGSAYVAARQIPDVMKKLSLLL